MKKILYTQILLFLIMMYISHVYSDASCPPDRVACQYLDPVTDENVTAGDLFNGEKIPHCYDWGEATCIPCHYSFKGLKEMCNAKFEICRDYAKLDHGNYACIPSNGRL